MTRHYWKRWMHVRLKSPLKADTERQQEGEKSTAQEAQKKRLTLAWSGREAQRRGRERKETRVLYLWTLFFSSAFICGCISEVSISQTYTPLFVGLRFLPISVLFLNLLAGSVFILILSLKMLVTWPHHGARCFSFFVPFFLIDFTLFCIFCQRPRAWHIDVHFFY